MNRAVNAFAEEFADDVPRGVDHRKTPDARIACGPALIEVTTCVSIAKAFLPVERRAHAGEVMIAVTDGVILQEELAGERGIGVERNWRGAIEVVVA